VKSSEDREKHRDIFIANKDKGKIVQATDIQMNLHLQFGNAYAAEKIMADAGYESIIPF
jgi:hypothetical protein